MVKKSRKIYFLGSVIIALASLFLVYFLLIVTGVVQVKNEIITITSGSVEATYSGMPVKCEEVEVTAGELRKGHTIKAIYTGEVVNVGSAANTYTFTILDSEGVDVTNKYTITKLEGTITVNKRPISLRASDASKEYDGTPLVSNSKEYSWVNGSLIAGHTIEVSSYGERTEAGIGENKLDVQIYDEFGNVMTQNYDIQVVSGALTVNPIPIVVSSGGDSKRYDGLPLTQKHWQLEQGELLDADNDGTPDHRIDAATNGSITDPGSVQNTFKYIKVYDIKTGKDVSDNYAIEEQYGMLEIQKVSLIFKSSDKIKFYDGNPFMIKSEVDTSGMTPDEIRSLLSKSDITLTAGTLFKGHTWDVVFGEFTETEVGKYVYSYDIVIYDENCNKITENYSYACQTGNLQIKPIDLIVKTESATKTYDGTPLYAYDEYDAETNPEGWRILSGELLDGHVLMVDEKTYTKLTDVYDYDKGNVLGVDNEIDFIVFDTINNKEVTNNYNIVNRCGKLIVMPIEISIKTPNDSVEYNGKTYKYVPSDIKNEVYLTSGAEVLESFGHKLDYSSFKFESELTPEDVSGVLNIPTIKIIDSNGKDVTKNYRLLTKDYGKLTYTTVEMTVESNGTEEEYKKGISLTCYDYVFKFGTASQIVNADKKEYTFKPNFLPNHEIRIKNDTALSEGGKINNDFNVDVYYLGTDGNSKTVKVTSYFEITEILGALKINPKVIYVDTPSCSKIYDGKEISETEYMSFTFVNSADETELLSENLRVVIDENQQSYIEAKKYSNNLSFSVLDLNNKKTSNYEVRINNIGEIEIKQYNVILQTSNRNFVYEEGKSFNEFSDGDVVPENDKYAFLRLMKGLNVFDVKELTTNFTDLTQLLPYWKSVNGVSQLSVELNSGDTLVVSGNWSEVTYGTVQNKPNKIYIVDSEGKDITNNYYFVEIFGNIQVQVDDSYKYPVKPKPIYVAYSDSQGQIVDMDYAFANGIYSSKNSIRGLETLLESGEITSYEATFKTIQNPQDLRNPGTHAGYIEIDTLRLYKGTEDVTENYQFEFVPGDVVIYENKITIETNSATKVYDGTPLVGTYEIKVPDEMKNFRIIINDNPEFNETGVATSITNVSQVINSVSCQIFNENGEDVTDVVLVDKKFGTLTITKAELVISFVDNDVNIIDKEMSYAELIEKGLYASSDDFNSSDYVITGLQPGHKFVSFKTEVINYGYINGEENIQDGSSHELMIKEIIIEDEFGNKVQNNYTFVADSITVWFFAIE